MEPSMMNDATPMAAHIAPTLGVAAFVWTLALGFLASRAARMAGFGLAVSSWSFVPGLSFLAAPAFTAMATLKPPHDIEARGGGMWKPGSDGGLSPVALLVGLLVSIGGVVGAFFFARGQMGLHGEPVQQPILLAIVVSSFVAGLLMSLLAKRVAFLESLFVVAVMSVLPVVLPRIITETFTYATADAYYAVILLTALLLMMISSVLGGSTGFLLAGDGEMQLGWGYEQFIGRRFLMGKRGDSVVGIITIISVLAVAVGTLAMVVVMSVMNGFSSDLKGKIFGSNAHLLVLKYGADFTDYDEVMKKTRNVQGVIGASPFVLNGVMVTSSSNAVNAVLKGIDVATSSQVTQIGSSIQKGSLAHLDEPSKIIATTAPTDGGKKPTEALDDAMAAAVAGTPSAAGSAIPGIAVGSEMAKNLRIFVGDTVNVVAPMGELGPTGPLPKARAFRVAAIFYTGMFEYDATFVYIQLKESQDFFSLKGGVTGIEYKVDDVDATQRVARDMLKEVGGYPYRTKDWMEMNRNLFSALKLEKIAMFIILNFIVLIASFLIAATLIVFVIEKSKEIAILKTMGATDTGIMKVFVTYGLTVGVLGTMVGMAGGLLVCFLLKTFGVGLDADVYYISNLPVHVEPVEVFSVGAAAVVLSFLATIYPALLAARLKPVDGLRYE
jgi:ABC-type lipoprotein release transport system permease subunit